MTPDEILRDLTDDSELRDWFLDYAQNYANARGAEAQELQDKAYDAAIDALARRTADIDPPKAWLRTVVHNAWRNWSKANKRELRSEALANVYEDPRSPYVLTSDEKEAIASDTAARKSKRERQELEYATRDLRPRDGRPAFSPVVVSRRD